MSAHFTVTRGNPTPDELAIAIAVLQAAGAASGEAARSQNEQPRRHWAAPLHAHRAHAHLRGGGMWTLSPRMR